MHVSYIVERFFERRATVSTLSTVRREVSAAVVLLIVCAWCPAILASEGPPDDAASLYHKAFDLLPEHTQAEYWAIDAALRGAEPNEVARDYLARAREAIETAQAATQVRACLWDVESHVEGDDLFRIGSQLREIGFVIEVDARACAVDGDGRLALEKCLSLRRLAAHICQEGDIGYLLSSAFDGRALLCMRYVLGTMAPEPDTLVWLQGQLGNVQGAPSSPGLAMEVTFGDFIRLYESNPESVSQWRANTVAWIDDETLKHELAALTEAEILQLGRQSYERYLASIHRMMASEKAYRHNHGDIVREKEALIEQAVAGDPVDLFRGTNASIVALYDLYTRRKANFNATRAAIEIYLLWIENDALPESLPPDLPKDSFSGSDFDYEITDVGFFLRCHQGEIEEGATPPQSPEIIWEYEFKVAKAN